jgi:nucleolar protein 56
MPYMVSLSIALQPFTSAENALSNCNDVSEGLLSSDLSALLTSSLPSASKSKKFSVGVADPKIGSAIQDTLGFPCATSDVITELLRACRTHAATVIPALSAAVPLPGGLLGHGVLEKAQLGLAHAYSRAKVKFNVNRSDNMIIQAIALLDGLDKDLNTFAMRVREWYGWHFPEVRDTSYNNNIVT